MSRIGLHTLRGLGFAEVQPFDASESPWRGRDPVAALGSVLPHLAGRSRPVGVYRHAGRWHLAWEVGDGMLLGAGPPEPSPAVSEEWEGLDWTVPPALAALYAVHDGLGPIDGPRAHWWRDAVLPCGALFPLIRRMRFGEEDILYRPGDLLLFCPDGRGGGQCFERRSPDDPDPPTRSWDMGTRQLGPPVPFERFLHRLVGRWMGEPRRLP